MPTATRFVSLILFASLIFVACDKGGGPMDPDPAKEIVWEKSHTISEFISQYAGKGVITDSAIIGGIVISSDEEKNISNIIYLANETDGICIAITNNTLFQSYPSGTELFILTTGLKLDADGSCIQLESGAALDQKLVDEQTKIIRMTTGLSPKNINDLATIDETLINRKIKLVGVQFDENVVDQDLSDGSAITDRQVTDRQGNTINVRILKDATFANEKISYNSGQIEGILILDNGDFVVVPIASDDFALTGSRHSIFQKMTFEQNGNTIPYQIMFPKGYNSSEKYPLLVFLHGAGERGNNNTSQMANGPNTFANRDARENYPAIVIFPQCPSSDMWSRRIIQTINGERIFSFPVEDAPNMPMGMVIDLTKKLMAEESVDEKRIYVMGLSMGGIGTFEYLYYAPEIPAAAISLAGGHDPAHAAVYGNDVSIRLYHGANDGVVPPDNSRNMIEALDMLTMEDAEYFEAEGRGHEWNYVLNDETQVLPWLWQKIRD